jgi:hypothetical protein
MMKYYFLYVINNIQFMLNSEKNDTLKIKV